MTLLVLRASRLRLLVVALLAVGALAGAPVEAAPPPAFFDVAGIEVASVEQLDARQYEVSVWSPVLERAVDVRILVPGDYGRRAAARYPVLYLFHGTSGRASDWVELGDAAAGPRGCR